MNYYYYIDVKTIKESEDSIDYEAVHSFNSTGVEEFSIEENKVDEILGERSYSGADLPLSVIHEVESVVIDESPQKKYYFTDFKDAENFKKYLRENFEQKTVIEKAEVKDWNKEWKKSYSPILVDKTLEVIPEWDKGSYDSKADKQIYIYPGMGFGTGSHETTYLCLKLMTEVVAGDEEVEECLDFGCGSGILALALRLFYPSSRLDLYDIDQEALDNCIQNIDLNNISMDNINLLLPDKREVINRKYKIVFANILQNVLLAEADYLVSSVKKNGFLILSGLLTGQEVEVVKKYQDKNPSLEFVKTVSKGDWVATLLVHK